MGGMMTGKHRFQGIYVSSIIVALAFVFLFSGCTTELLDTVQKMVDFAHRDDKDAPQIIFTTPSFGAQSIPKNIKVTVTFDEPMDPETINNSSFTLELSGTAQPGTVTYLESHNMAMWTPSFPFFDNTVYTGKIRTSVRDASGNKMQSEYTWNFQTGNTTDGSPPTLDFNFPSISATGLGINIDIIAGFSEPLDPSSVNGSTFGLFLGTDQVEGVVNYIDSSTSIVFVPSSDLLPNTSYTVKVSGTIRDLAGNELGANQVWDFETGATSDIDPPSIVLITTSSLNPASSVNSVNVQVTDKIMVEFDEDMNPETINNTTFNLEGLEEPIPGEVIYNPGSRRAIFRPFESLNKMEIFTASMSGAVEDAAGNQMGSGASWQFMTVSPDTSVTGMSANVVKVVAGPGAGELTAYVLVTNQASDPLPGLLYLNFQAQERIGAGSYGQVPSQTFAMGSSRESKSVVFVVDDTVSMNSYWLTYRDAIVQTVAIFDAYDKAEFITFASQSNVLPARELTVWPPGATPPQPNSLTTDKDLLMSYFMKNDIVPHLIPAYVFSFVCDAIGYGMQDLVNQQSDEMRGLNAVIAFTDATPPFPAGTFTYGEWRTTAGGPEILVDDYAITNNILIYSIAFGAATFYQDMQIMGTSTSGYYYPATSPGQFFDAYFQALGDMDGRLRELYTVTWNTAGKSGDSVDVSMRVNYAHTSSFFSDTDEELDYTIP